MWRDWRVAKALARFFVGEEKPPVVIEATGSQADRSKGIIKKLGLAFVKSSSGRTLNFEEPTGFSFDEIERAYLTDSYIRQACDKYVDFMFKAGWDVVGKNPKAIEYIKLRLAAAAAGTEKPTSEFLTEVAEDLIRYHNVFIIKARAGNSYVYPAGLTATPVLATKTVAGYYVLPVSTMTIARDPNGTVKKYKQTVPGNSDKLEINPSEIIHIAMDKPQGRAFGFPFIWQALDDIKLLRQMEELTDRMVYKNIFPLIHYKVGLDADGQHATDEEIEEVRQQLAELPLDGGIVTSERHNILAVAVGDKVLAIEPILSYFKKRVFTGLGVSATIMGETDTANKSTSDNLDQMFKDRVKAYQKVIEQNINAKLIYELLLEGGFDPLVNPQDDVQFVFREIDLQAKMAEQNHVVQLFTQNAITHEQMRMALGYEPVTPEEESRLYFNMITIPTAVQTAEASAAARQTTAANNAGENKNRPANQHGKRSSAKTKNSMEEAVLSRTNIAYMADRLQTQYDNLKGDVLRQVRQYMSKGKPLSEYDGKEIELTCMMAGDYMASLAERYVGPAFIEGVLDAQKQAGKQADINMTYNVSNVREEFKKLTTSLMKDLKDQIVKALKSSSEEDVVPTVVGAFGALQYRLKFMSTTQVYSAYNVGFAKAARSMGYEEATLISATSEADCPTCGPLAGKSISLLSGKLPPFHPNCTCLLSLNKKEGS